MYRKRRLTVQPVDAARFCGGNNGAVVSFLNGMNHLVVDPAATDVSEQTYLPSRVLVHAYAGAQLADAAVMAQEECIEEAAVNAAAVVACRVTLLQTSRACPSADYPVRVEGRSKVVFFSGCQRLAEVCIDDGVSGASSTPMQLQYCPIQCFRVESGDSVTGVVTLDMAAFLKDPRTLCACTPQLGKLQTLRFEEGPVCCMGPGRVGRAEVTVVLSNGVAALCGVRPVPQVPAAYTAQECAEPAAAARQAFLAANELSSIHVLQTVQLPSRGSPSAIPLRVAWSGATTLWAVYSDSSVVAVRCCEESGTGTNTENDEELQQSSWASARAGGGGQAQNLMTVAQVLEAQLGVSCAQSSHDGNLVMEQVQIHAEPRATVLHFAFTTTDTPGSGQQRLHYGTVRLHGAPPAAQLQFQRHEVCYGEKLYGVRFERGQFHLLSQSTPGAGPLYVATLLRSAAAAPAASAGAPDAAPSLALTIMQCAEGDLSSHCRGCEVLLKELQTAARQLTCAQDAELLLHRLMQAQHALYALLTRQQQSASVRDLAASESLPCRLLQRATQLFREHSAYTLFARLGIMHTVSGPVKDVLRLSEATAISGEAQAQWKSLMHDTFRRESVYQSSVAELAMWQAATPLCVEVILDRLGLSAADASLTMTSALAKMDAVTPDMALFILYYSYVGLEHRSDASGAQAQSSPAEQQQQQQREWRESFLFLFDIPTELNAWAFTCYAVDHGLNPAEVAETERNKSFVHAMGPTVQHLGAPPFLRLLAPVVNGLAHAAALDVLLRLIPICIAAYTGAGEGVPVAVAMRLLCVAVRAGSSPMIEALYEVMRSFPELRHLAAQPLAYAALHAGSVSAMRGWVEVGSPAAETIERTLQGAEGVRQREAALISFHILLQRYEDALQACSSATPADATQAQRLQVVLSYLHSLQSASSKAWGARKPVAACDVDPQLLVDRASVLPLWRPTTLAAPLLQVSSRELAEQLARAAASAGEHGSHSGAAAAVLRGAVSASGAATVPVSGVLGEASAAYQHPHSTTGNGLQTHARAPLFRPSTLLSSVERGSGAGSSAASSSSSPAAAASGAAMTGQY
ncbi:hypothetical protein LSCM1_01930 [Leishmania martiniquensis]|uniref:Uncharacterized protein n=1 Tax=Leishmania martiniquensis TaxID=1580590 RepID=A0A836GC50_9TRYP|nr:hypothetical protein LSCM1_01930 [Leishmania martiniquensis]